MRLPMYVLGIGALLLTYASLARAATDEQRCEASILRAASNYGGCRNKARAAFLLNQSASNRDASLIKCGQKLTSAYNKIAAKFGGVCPVETLQHFIDAIDQCTDALLNASEGGVFPVCGDNAVNSAGEQCDGSDLGGTTCVSLGFGSGSLACNSECQFDTNSCAPEAGSFDVSVSCSAGGQLCEPSFDIVLHASSLLAARFVLGPFTCSPFTIHASVDGSAVGSTEFSGTPGQELTLFTIPVSPGAHSLSFQAEGQVGGCNSGDLIGWGGTLSVAH